MSWQVATPELVELLGHPDAARARQAFEAMLPMSKLDVAAIRAATEGEESRPPG